MSAAEEHGPATLEVASARHVDQVCDRFEAAWKAARSTGQRPRIEEYLVDVPEPERALLLRELIKLEIAERGQAAEVIVGGLGDGPGSPR